jgi:hypothetical protein
MLRLGSALIPSDSTELVEVLSRDQIILAW